MTALLCGCKKESHDFLLKNSIVHNQEVQSPYFKGKLILIEIKLTLLLFDISSLRFTIPAFTEYYHPKR